MQMSLKCAVSAVRLLASDQTSQGVFASGISAAYSVNEGEARRYEMQTASANLHGENMCGGLTASSRKIAAREK